jgi:hypothetical protein
MAEKEKEAKFKLKNLQVFKVDLVGKAATGDEFLALRKAQTESEDGAMRRVMPASQYNEQTDGNITVSEHDVVRNEDGDFVVNVPEEVEAEASSEDNSDVNIDEDNVSRDSEKGEDQMDEIKEILGNFAKSVEGTVERLDGIASRLEKHEPAPETTTSESEESTQQEGTTERSEEKVTEEVTTEETTEDTSDDNNSEDVVKRFDEKVDGIINKIDKVVEKVDSLEKKVDSANGRIDDVERSLKTTSAKETDENEEPTERSEGSFWNGVLGPIGKAS